MFAVFSDLRRISFGATSALVTGMGLIIGLDAATVAKSAVISSLLIIGVADNLTDSLSVHMYQESERLEERRALRTTVANFFVRLLISISFVALLLVLPLSSAIGISLAWGFVLLSTLTYGLARLRQVNPLAEICRHGSIAIAVIALSKAIGSSIPYITAWL